jgi:hypothetical protein
VRRTISEGRDVSSEERHAGLGSASKGEQKEGSRGGGIRIDSPYLNNFDNLTNHADAFEIAPTKK